MNDKGMLHTSESIHARFRERNMKQELRELGLIPEFKNSYSDADFQNFARVFDVLYAKLSRPTDQS